MHLLASILKSCLSASLLLCKSIEIHACLSSADWNITKDPTEPHKLHIARKKTLQLFFLLVNGSFKSISPNSLVKERRKMLSVFGERVPVSNLNMLKQSFERQAFKHKN